MGRIWRGIVFSSIAAAMPACMMDDGSYGAWGEGCGDDCATPPDPEKNQVEPDEQDVCDEDANVLLYLSPDDSNSMSSPVQVREAILSGWAGPEDVAVRPWEFLNYYTFEYPVAEPGGITLRAEMRASEEVGEFQLQIGVGSEAVSNAARAPMNVTLVLDESGSMGGEPIERLKDVSRAIAGSLRSGDIISMVSWDTENNTRLANHSVSGPNDPTVLAAIDEIQASGGTDLHGGLTRGYELALASYDAQRINRVVLISDGGANVGITDADFIGDNAEAEDSEGIYLVGVGVGTPGTYNDELMDTVTDRGKGASVFIPTTEEAEKMFGERFVNTMDVAVRDVRVELQMPPGFEIKRFSGEEYSDDPSEIEPQHLAPNDAMVFYQEIATCAPELVTPDSEITVTVRWKDKLSHADRSLSHTVGFGELLSNNSPQLEKAVAILSAAEAVEAGAPTSMVDSARADLESAQALLPGDADLAEIAAVLNRL